LLGRKERGVRVMLKTVTTTELKGLMESGASFTLVNVLAEGRFESEHICGSINIPLKDIERDAGGRLDRGERIIVHCSGAGCTASEAACGKLLDMGYTDVARYVGGMEEWKGSGGCLEGTLSRRAA